MSAVCPNGHQSATTDFCDVCGTPIAAATPPAKPIPEAEETDTSTTTPAQPCPACGTVRSGDDRFCEACGHDFLTAQAAPGVDHGWEAVVAADRGQFEFERCAPTGIPFPDGFTERRYVLDQPEIRIGRSRGPADGPTLEIDLAGRQEDPGISRRHAVLRRLADGSYAVSDLGSTNGTTLNDDPHPLVRDAAVPLADGDRVRLGAWTTITLRKASKVVRGEQA